MDSNELFHSNRYKEFKEEVMAQMYKQMERNIGDAIKEAIEVVYSSDADPIALCDDAIDIVKKIGLSSFGEYCMKKNKENIHFIESIGMDISEELYFISLETKVTDRYFRGYEAGLDRYENMVKYYFGIGEGEFTYDSLI